MPNGSRGRSPSKSEKVEGVGPRRLGRVESLRRRDDLTIEVREPHAAQGRGEWHSI